VFHGTWGTEEIGKEKKKAQRRVTKDGIRAVWELARKPIDWEKRSLGGGETELPGLRP